jgi:acyl dehydratase
MEGSVRYEVVAHNTATASSNRIHDDAVARRYGFRGGLVPGVDVYAYMTRPVVDRWGIDWLRRGTLQARFLSPVYDGERVTVTITPAEATDAGEPALTIEVVGEDGQVRATGRATLPDGSGPTAPSPPPPPAPSASTHPGDPPTDPPEASPESLAEGTTLRLPAHRFAFEPDMAGYLVDVRDDLPLYRDRRIAHPGWLLRYANRVLGSNVRLGPWIHVESHVRHHDVLGEQEALVTRAVVTREWESKGHRFVALAVGLLTDDGRPVAHIEHTAIYRPRAA